MKLFYMPGACSLAPHIVAREAGLELELVKVDGKTKSTEADTNFLDTNPNGYVPALVLPDGELMTEASVLVQYLADQKPETGLMPAAGVMERYRVQQWLAFVATELHKVFGSFFKPNTPEATKEINRELLGRRLAYVDGKLEGRPYLTGDDFTAADAYLWTILGWARLVGIDLSSFANIQRFLGTVGARPAVQQALRAEGLA
ncbi:glutathione transferase GstA [Mesorhizobium sp. ZMM04-5]|uniref:Glutathione transferase GstA n=1 Tax=Mesorhizobium marinum TaxID=3228790 RepID=A0ABV3R1Q3_9HYPH